MDLKVADYTQNTHHALVVDLNYHIDGIKDKLTEKVKSMEDPRYHQQPYWQQLTRYSILFVGATLNQVAEFRTWVIRSQEKAKKNG